MITFGQALSKTKFVEDWIHFQWYRPSLTASWVLEYSDDRHDAFFLAKLLILGILPEGYIYPKERRPVRDLARKRIFLVRHKTSNILSLQSLVQRCCAIIINASDIRKLTVVALEKWLKEESLVFTAQASLDTINFLKRENQTQ